MIRTFVMLSLAFLLGGIAAVTYFTLFADNNSAKENKNINARARYAMSASDDNYYTMKILDSLTAATNYPITSRNRVIRVSPDSTNVSL